MNRLAASPALGNRQSGLTMVEMMVALVISLVLLAGVLQVYLSSKSTYKANEGLSRLQEDGRFAMATLTKSLQAAGFRGCSSYQPSESPVVAASYTGGTLTSSNALSLSGQDDLAAGNSLGAKTGTDSITIRRAASPAYTLKNDVPIGNTSLTLSTTGDFKSGQDALITDCVKTDIFQTAAGTSGSTVNSATALRNYLAPANSLGSCGAAEATVYHYRDDTYYIGDSGRKTTTGLPIYSLYVVDPLTGAPAQPLVDGVENMQIQYLQDGGSNYVDASAVTDWDAVIGVRLSLFVDSVNDAQPQADTSTYQIGPKSYTVPATPPDRRLHKVFTTTISLNNHLQ